MEGINGIRPKIKKISFVNRGQLTVSLEDGRIISVPLRFFPSIKKLNVAQRRKPRLIGDMMFTWNDCDEVFHLEQILGSYKDYKYTPQKV